MTRKVKIFTESFSNAGSTEAVSSLEKRINDLLSRITGTYDPSVEWHQDMVRTSGGGGEYEVQNRLTAIVGYET